MPRRDDVAISNHHYRGLSPFLSRFEKGREFWAGASKVHLSMKLDLKNSNIDRLRLSSILDGVSYLILLGVAMPLKYLADMPMAVRVVGSLHGLFFVALCLFLLIALLRKQLSFGWCVIVFLCALVPFAPFWLDHRLKEKASEGA